MALLARIGGWARIVRRDGLTLWFAVRHPAVPWYAKVLGFVAVAYALSPIDLIPDFIPILGMLDDLVILPALIWVVLKLIPSRVLDECRTRAEQWIRDKKHKVVSWVGGAVIVAIWIAIIVAVWRAWIGPWLAA